MQWSWDKQDLPTLNNMRKQRMSSRVVFVSSTGILLQGTSITITDEGKLDQYGIGTTVLEIYSDKIGSSFIDYKGDIFRVLELSRNLVPSPGCSMPTEKGPNTTW
jgi:hypothetical protein